jgi:hypothetical protein
MIKKWGRFAFCALVISLSFYTLPYHSLDSHPIERTLSASLPQIDLNQTASLKLAFLGIPSDYVNQSTLLSFLPQTFDQFQYPNPYTITWSLNYSFFFCPFPQNISDSLLNNSFRSGGETYFNTILLDGLVPQTENLDSPKCGYLLAFMWIPNATGHSWFYVQERPDLFLNRTDYINGVPSQTWIFPSNFGGLRRALYFDISETMELAPTQSTVTSTIAELVSNSLGDMFHNLLGSTDPRWVEADLQNYQNYTVRILWLNGTGGQLPLEGIPASFEDLMPWTNWTLTIETRPADSELNDFIESQTVELSPPATYSYLLSNGTNFTIEAQRSVLWNPLENSGENDPVNQYFFNHVKDYFGLTDLDDKSVIPVVLLQLDNDTAFGGYFQGGVSWFPHNVIIVAFQGSVMTGLGESGPVLLADLLRHEIGHWLSLSHYSSDYGSGYPKIICPMSFMLTNEFCAFSKDARARMSFISFYDATIGLLSKNQTKAAILEGELNDSLQSFYDWDYTKAVEGISSIHFSLDTTPPNIVNVLQSPPKDNVSPYDEVEVNATVTDDLSGVKRVTLNYTCNNGTWNAVDMTNLEGNIWNASIPAFSAGTNVTYAIIAEDNFNNLITSQEMGLEYEYHVIPEFSIFLILPGLIAATLLATVTRRRRNSKSLKS